MDKSKFENAIRAGHHLFLFTTFIGVDHPYLMAIRCAKDWLDRGSFEISDRDIKRVREHFEENLQKQGFENFRNMKDYIEKDSEKWENIVKGLVELRDDIIELLEENKGECKIIGVGLAPYLFTWNIQRFKEYVKVYIYIKRNETFNVKNYFKDLGDILNELRNDIREFKDLRLVDEDSVPKEKVEKLFNSLNEKLRKIGIGQNEYIMTIKILHALSPSFFPLLDNKILDALKNSKCDINKDSRGYIKWMEHLQTWLKGYLDVIPTIEEELDQTILKLVDELLYVTYSIKLENYVKKLRDYVENLLTLKNP